MPWARGRVHDVAVSPINVLSLCSGVGGLELGIGLALNHRGQAACGICYVEGEAAAAASLVASMEAGWFHPAPVWSDVTTFDGRPWRGLVHILASGDPCQDNSAAGKRLGAAGERFLAPEVVRIAEECRPDLVFRENVVGNIDGQLAALVPPLEGLGYRVAAGIFSSAETGNTMRRERLFVMARASLQQSGEEGLCRRRSKEWFGGTGRELVEPEGVGPGESRTEHAGEQGRRVATGAGGAMGSAFGRVDKRNAQDSQRQSVRRVAVDGPGGRDSEPVQPGAGLARSCGARSQGIIGGQHHAQGRQEPSRHAGLRGRTVLPPAVIPGPTDSRWIDVLDRWPELQPALSQEEAESHLRRGVDAMANRVERLRATGNGVDPICSAYAFLSLSALLHTDREAI